jgi:4'-phosphopantetheinyl transferase
MLAVKGRRNVLVCNFLIQRATGGREAHRRTIPADAKIWTVDLDQPHSVLKRFSDILDEGDRARLRRISGGQQRSRRLVARAALRCILAAESGQSADAIRLGYLQWGKPIVLGAHGLEFSVSSAGQSCVIATVRGVDVGIDIEQVKLLPGMDEFAAEILSPRELAAVRHADDRLKQLYRLWTRKEAYAKALGIGLAVAPRTLEVGLDSTPDRSAWSLHDLDPAPNSVGALAVRAPRARISIHPFEFPRLEFPSLESAGGPAMRPASAYLS